MRNKKMMFCPTGTHRTGRKTSTLYYTMVFENIQADLPEKGTRNFKPGIYPLCTLMRQQKLDFSVIINTDRLTERSTAMKKTIIISTLVVILLMTFSVVSADLSRDHLPSLVLQTEGDEALYEKAKTLYESHKYAKAHDLFIESQYGDWERMAKKCVRRWPKKRRSMA